MNSETDIEAQKYYEEFLQMLRRNNIPPDKVVYNYNVLSKIYKYSKSQSHVISALKAFRTYYSECRVSALIEQGNADNFEELPPLPDQKETNQ